MERAIKTYGVRKGYVKGKERYFLICDDSTTNIHYAKKERAIKEAERFVKYCYENHRNYAGEKVLYLFQYKGGE